MNHYELEKIVNQQLNTAAFSDYAPNGDYGRDRLPGITG